MMTGWRGVWIFQNPRTPWFHRGINVLACAFCISSPTLQRSANFTWSCGFERSKQNPPVPHFDHIFYAHLVFQATYHNLHFLSTHWNNRRLVEPRGTSGTVFSALRFRYSNQTLFLHILHIVLHFFCRFNTAFSLYIWAPFDKQHIYSHSD